MYKPLKSEAGVALVLELILVAAVLTVAGVAIFQAYSKHTPNPTPTPKVTASSPSPTATPNPYEGWKSSSLTQEGLSIKYPADWKLATIDGVNTQQKPEHLITLTSPLRAGNPNVFAVSIVFNNDNQPSVSADVLEVADLDVAGSKKPLYLITSDLDGGKGFISMNLSEDKAVAAQTKATLQILSQKDSASPITMEATLMRPGAQQGSSTGLAAFKSHPDYPALLKIFQSLSYN